MRKKFNWKACIVLVIIAGMICWFFNDNAARIISIISIMIVSALILVSNLEKPGARQIILMASPVFSNLLRFFEDTDFAKALCAFYNSIIQFVCTKLDISSVYALESYASLMITFWIVFSISYIIIELHNRNKQKGSSTDNNAEFRKKNYTEKSMMFCKTLRQRLERINSKTDWNESLFTPIEAEIEACVNGKRKKKYDDLLKCLKRNKRNNTVFLVLGDPGSGKSVALRKLCLELLDEANKTKKIPVYIDLKRWNEDWDLNKLPQKKDLINFIKTTLYEDGDVFTDEFLNSYFDIMLEDGRWYFIFDSFDELPCLMGKQSCQELIDNLSALLYQFLTGANQNGGVIASRLYRAPSDALGATVTLKIQEFSDIKIKIMLQKYLNNATDVVKELFGNREDLVVLCRNPFYLTLLINYIRENGISFPENQMQLYNSFVKGRLDKCAGRIENENMSVAEIHNAAKKLAVYMQQSTKYGLECPAEVFYQDEDKQYWQKALELLKYAKICRFGGSDETVSFVHRRFQEFFLVENIIEKKKDIDREEYNSIVNNSGMRDALVLYCEIAQEDKALDIAAFCWDVIKKNIKYKNSITNKECVELVNTLYFMTEAFRNRRSALENYLESFEKLVEDNLKTNTDFVVLHALTSSMVLFKQEHLQQMVLKVFQLRNRWLADVVMQNCRIMRKLSSRIETKFYKYFCQLNAKTFLERFRNTQFSLSLSKGFQYVKSVHLSIFLAKASLAITAAFTSIAVTVLYLNNLKLITISKVNWLPEEAVANSIGFFEFFTNITQWLGLLLKNDFIVCIYLLLLVFYMFSKKNLHDLSNVFIMCIELSLSALFGLWVMEYGIFVGHIWLGLVTLILALNIMLPRIHDVYYAIKERRFKVPWDDVALTIGISSIAAIIIILITVLAFFLYQYVIIALYCVSALIAICCLLFFVVPFVRDWYWVKHQPAVKRISRQKLAENLSRLSTEKWKCVYVDFLLQNKVHLTEAWPKNARPTFSNDELVLKLAKLDCLGLDNLHSRI